MSTFYTRRLREKISHTKWGADQKNLIKIHRMIILSTLRYGEEAYGSASQPIFKKLEPTHNRGLKLALGLGQSTEIRE
jgi:hypothetical protein